MEAAAARAKELEPLAREFREALVGLGILKARSDTVWEVNDVGKGRQLVLALCSQVGYPPDGAQDVADMVGEWILKRDAEGN